MKNMLFKCTVTYISIHLFSHCFIWFNHFCDKKKQFWQPFFNFGHTIVENLIMVCKMHSDVVVQILKYSQLSFLNFTFCVVKTRCTQRSRQNFPVIRNKISKTWNMVDAFHHKLCRLFLSVNQVFWQLLIKLSKRWMQNIPK